MADLPTLLLVHGSWHGPWCWEKLTPELEARGLPWTTVALPSVGASVAEMAGMMEDAAAIEMAAAAIPGDVIVVHTPEEFGADQADGVEAFITTLERNNVVLDLDNTELIDSRGLTVVLAAQDRLRELGGDLKIATTNHANRKILEITRLDDALDVFDSVIDAVKSFC